VIARGAQLNPRGEFYSTENIQERLALRSPKMNEGRPAIALWRDR